MDLLEFPAGFVVSDKGIDLTCFCFCKDLQEKCFVAGNLFAVVKEQVDVTVPLPKFTLKNDEVNKENNNVRVYKRTNQQRLCQSLLVRI